MVTLDNMMSSLIGPFIGQCKDWKIEELSSFKCKLKAINVERKPTQVFYFYENFVYTKIYDIIGTYKNYPGRPRTFTHNQFNKIISKLKLEVKHGVAIYQNP